MASRARPGLRLAAIARGEGRQRRGPARGGAAVRAAVASAEEMAGHKLSGVIVQPQSCGQPESRVQTLQWTDRRPRRDRGGPAHRDLAMAAAAPPRRGARACTPSRSASPSTRRPAWPIPARMMCDTLGARLHLVGRVFRRRCATWAPAWPRCDLEVGGAGFRALRRRSLGAGGGREQLGATVIDMGGGTTSLAVVHEGHLLHTAQIPVGGWQVTNDLARGLATPIAQAERLKTLHGGVISAPVDDEREMLPVPQVGEDEEHLSRVPRSAVAQHHPPAAGGNARAGARPPQRRRPRSRGRLAGRADRRRQPVGGLARTGRPHRSNARCGSAARIRCAACPRWRTARASPPRWACSPGARAKGGLCSTSKWAPQALEAVLRVSSIGYGTASDADLVPGDFTENF